MPKIGSTPNSSKRASRTSALRRPSKAIISRVIRSCGERPSAGIASARSAKARPVPISSSSAARAARDWPAADRIRAEIEAAGWKIVDRGTDFALEPAQAPTVATDGLVRYGSVDAVPSRLDEPDSGRATVVLVATDWPADLDR